MIGTEALANFISDAVRDMPTDEWSELHNVVMPDGWTYLGSGAWRHAFKGPDGFVYKVAICAGDDTNEEQCMMWRSSIMDKKFEGFRFAAMDYFYESNVQVCEYVEGTHPKWGWDEISRFSQKVRRSLEGMPFLDIHRRNVIVSNGELVIIDF